MTATPKRILVTGSRDHVNRPLIRNTLRRYRNPATVLVHGAGAGADVIAASTWRSWGCPVEAHPADWSTGRGAGPVRNQLMVDLGADLCIAFPLAGSSGTYDCVRRAADAGIPVRVVIA